MAYFLLQENVFREESRSVISHKLIKHQVIYTWEKLVKENVKSKSVLPTKITS